MAFRSQTLLSSHMNQHASEIILKCSSCSATFKSENDRKIHFEKEHLKETNELEKNAEKISDTKSTEFKCSKCEMVFKAENLLASHIYLHNYYDNKKKLTEKENLNAPNKICSTNEEIVAISKTTMLNKEKATTTPLEELDR